MGKGNPTWSSMCFNTQRKFAEFYIWVKGFGYETLAFGCSSSAYLVLQKVSRGLPHSQLRDHKKCDQPLSFFFLNKELIYESSYTTYTVNQPGSRANCLVTLPVVWVLLRKVAICKEAFSSLEKNSVAYKSKLLEEYHVFHFVIGYFQ